MARRKPSLSLSEPIPTIIGAGITEQYYFSHLQGKLGLKIRIRPRFFGHENVHSLEKRIEQVLDAEGFAIVVFDTDVSQWNESERKRLVALKRRYTNNRHVILCESMPSIEFWFLLHYCKTNRYFGTCDAVVKELVKYLPDFGKHESFLKGDKWVDNLIERMKAAYDSAKSFGVGGESYTNLWRAFNYLKPDKFK